MKLLLRLYPPPWRARYGAELEAMVADGGGLRPAVVADLAVAAVRERLREPAVVVLQAWTLFVVAGIGVQKLSEHWRPAGGRTEPAWAFDGIVVGAAFGSACVVVAALLALRVVLRVLPLRRTILTLLTVAAAASTGGVVWWVHGASRPAAASHAIGIAWVLLLVATLASWTSAGAAVARQASVNRWLVRAVTAAMVEMTVCTAVFWSASRVGAALLVPLVAMVVASTAGALATS